MIEKALSLLNAVANMSPELEQHLTQILTPRHIPKHTEILPYGQVCHEIFYLGNGMVIGQKYQKRQEVTTFIMREGAIVTSPESFFNRTASNERLFTIEPCDILVMTWQQLEDTYKTFENFERHGRIITQQYYIMNLQHTDEVMRYTVEEKYRRLLERDRELERRCPNVYLASYLNCNQTTLSTVRSKVLGEQKVTKSKE